ncbi:FMN-linked oxidoreductase [Xylariaceae sp. FL1651]|nr:FMN-linked oxidoreductase [Xylariaceae sp. FL1651]
MVDLPPQIHIEPPLFNSANPWATTLEDLQSLYKCTATGAVTTRTALLEQGFPHDESVHQFAFFETATHSSSSASAGPRKTRGGVDDGQGGREGDASLNTLGYSPIPLDEYLGFIRRIDEEEEEESEGPEEEHHPSSATAKGDDSGGAGTRRKKPFIVSVTGSPDEVAECYRRIAWCRFSGRRRGGEPGRRDGGGGGGGVVSREGKGVGLPLAMEVNLSCPNIPGKPPPAYEGEALRTYIRRVAEAAREVAEQVRADRGADAAGGEQDAGGGEFRIPWGLKTPPYTHAGQFEMFVEALRGCSSSLPLSLSLSPGKAAAVATCPVSFVTATNTLGSCLLLAESSGGGLLSPALPGRGIGGLAGAPLHPLALGNVATLRRMLDAAPETRHVALLGIGGVGDAEAYRRMRSVGAVAVGVGTALGRKGVGVFDEIERGLGGRWEV